MGFFSSILNIAVKTVFIPVAVVKDAINVVTDEEPDTTIGLVESTFDDLNDAVDDIFGY